MRRLIVLDLFMTASPLWGTPRCRAGMEIFAFPWKGKQSSRYMGPLCTKTMKAASWIVIQMISNKTDKHKTGTEPTLLKI